jgi:hypothetical protein
MWAPLLAGLSRLIGSRIGQWVLSALAFLGLYYATSEFAVQPLLDFIQSKISGAPEVAIQTLGYIGFDVYVTAVLSAWATAIGASALRLRKR